MRHGIRRRSQLPKSLLLRAKVLIELLRCICRLLAHSVALNPACRGLLIGGEADSNAAVR
jgi:hypothetical protein